MPPPPPPPPRRDDDRPPRRDDRRDDRAPFKKPGFQRKGPPPRATPRPPGLLPNSPPQRSPTAKPPTQATDWSDVADWYDNLVGDDGSEYHQKVVLPGTLKLLAATAEDHVLDLACGQGVFCRQLHTQGIPVTGVDAAADLIAAAKTRGPSEIPYLPADARDLSRLPEASFTAATCLLAIQNMHPLPPVMSSVARVLKPAGRIVLVMMHPCFRSPKACHWGWDEATRTQYRRVDKYLTQRKEPIVTHPGKKDGVYTWSFHRPISDYINALGKAGLFVDAMEEWPSHKTSDSGPRAPAENTARAEIPMFLALRAVKK